MASCALALLALVSSLTWAAAPRDPELPAQRDDGVSCGVPAYSTELLVPSFDDRKASDDARRFVSHVRGSLLTTHRALMEIYSGAVEALTLMPLECNMDWDDWSVLYSSSLAAVRAEYDQTVLVNATGADVSWKREPVSAVAVGAAEFQSWGRYGGICKPLESFLPLYEPRARGLPPESARLIDQIAPVTHKLSGIIAQQQSALATVLREAQGRECRAIVQSFDRLLRSERALYLDYRRRAVADAVWGQLDWEPVGQRPAGH